jgi:hypothetical protein
MLNGQKLTTFMCRLSRNLVASTPGTLLTCNRPPQGLLYLHWRLFFRGYSSWDVHLATLLRVVRVSGSECMVICLASSTCGTQISTRKSVTLSFTFGLSCF